MSKIVNFEIQDAEILDENIDSQFATARLLVFSSGMNRHDMNCSEEVLRRTAPTIYEKPIIFGVDRKYTDFTSHGEDTVPGGFIVADSAEFVPLSDGRVSLQVMGKIWKKYSGTFMDIFKKRPDSTKKISVEMELTDFEMLDEEIIEMKDFSYTAACVLGDEVIEASPGAKMEMLSFARKEYMQDYNKEFGMMRYKDIDFLIPDSVKKNAQLGIQKFRELGYGGTSTSVSIAKHLMARENISPQKARLALRYLMSRKNNDMSSSDVDGLNKEYIGFLMCGGDEGFEFVQRVCEAMDTIDNSRRAFFGSDDFAREMGKGKSISANKSKDKLSDGAWGDVDKAELRNKVLESPNYKSLVKDVYMLVDDGWEESPSSKLKYPVMEVKNGELVYNRGALASALGYARKNGEDTVVEKVVSIYKKMEIAIEEDNCMEEKGMEKDKKEEFETNAPPKEEAPKEEQMASEEKMSDAVAEEEKEEEEKEGEVGEESKGAFSSSTNLDLAAIMSFLKEETDAYREMAEKFASQAEEVDYSALVGYMKGRIEQMGCKMEEMAKENDGLKAFKAEVERGQMQYEVDSTIKEIQESVAIPQEQIYSLVEDSKNHTLNTLEEWKNKARALAFQFAKKSNTKTAEPRAGLLWTAGNAERGGLWIK